VVNYGSINIKVFVFRIGQQLREALSYCKMRRWAFIVAILGLFVLAWLLFNLEEKEVFGEADLGGLVANTRVVVSGVVEEEKSYGSGARMILDNGVELVCDCFGFGGKSVEAVGIVEDYTGVKRVRVLRIVIIEN
tara:strand:- start:232 stop:636 length:405 start_codon:yes stop_codon:yes gene_type:complete